MRRVTEKELRRRERQRAIMERRWKDPEYRARMVRKQMELGYRAYGARLNPLLYKKDNTFSSEHPTALYRRESDG